MLEKDKSKGNILVTENSDEDQFPVGMRVLAIDANSVCLKYLVALLEICRYKVTATTKAEEALKILRENKDEFDIVITDVIRQDIDGFKLLQIIGIEMDIPVIMVSANEDQANISRSVNNGARDYLMKPLRLQEMRNIWQHVFRKKLNNSEKSCITKEITDKKSLPPKTVKDKLKREEDQATNTRSFSTRKKTRFTWTPNLHLKFVNAIRELGDQGTEAVPNKILRIMDVPGLTRGNVASHLQKYRSILEKQSAAVTKEKIAEPDSNLASGNSDNKKSYGTAYQTMSEEMPGNFVDHLGNVFSKSEALDNSPTDLREKNLKPRELEIFQYYMHSPHSMGQMQQGIHSHVYGNLPSTPLPTKTYLPVPDFQFPNIFPGIKLHDGYMGISSQTYSYSIGGQAGPGSRPPFSHSLLDDQARYSFLDQAGASSARLYSYPSAVSYTPPSQMLVEYASTQMGASSQHASVAWPLQNFLPDQHEGRSSFNICETGDTNLKEKIFVCPDYKQDANLSDLKLKGKAKAVQYFPEHRNMESGSHRYSSSLTDDDLAVMVKEFTDDAPPKL